MEQRTLVFSLMESLSLQDANEAWRPPCIDWSKPIMGRYLVEKDALIRQGDFCVVRKGRDCKTGEAVAVKTYNAASKAQWPAVLQAFNREVELMQRLLEPLGTSELAWLDSEAEKGQRVTSKMLEKTDMSTLFVELLDYSKGDGISGPLGKPGPHPSDGMLYIVMELGEFSLHDYVQEVKLKQKQLSQGDVQRITRSLFLMLAAFHSKGFVRLNVRPKCVMNFYGSWKFAEITDTVLSGMEVNATDCVRIAPLYCCPRVASLCATIVAGTTQASQSMVESSVKISSSMDVWSLGLSLLEFCISEPLLQNVFNKINEETAGDISAYFTWLSDPTQAIKLPQEVLKFDEDFHDLLQVWMLDKEESKRKCSFQCLNHQFIWKTLPSAEYDSEAVMEHLEKVNRSKLARPNVEWDYEEELVMLSESIAPDGQADWTNDTNVKVRLSVSFSRWSILGIDDGVEFLGSLQDLDGAMVGVARDDEHATCDTKSFVFTVDRDDWLVVLATESKKDRRRWITALREAAAGGIRMRPRQQKIERLDGTKRMTLQEIGTICQKLPQTKVSDIDSSSSVVSLEQLCVTESRKTSGFKSTELTLTPDSQIRVSNWAHESSMEPLAVKGQSHSTELQLLKHELDAERQHKAQEVAELREEIENERRKAAREKIEENTAAQLARERRREEQWATSLFEEEATKFQKEAEEMNSRLGETTRALKSVEALESDEGFRWTVKQKQWEQDLDHANMQYAELQSQSRQLCQALAESDMSRKCNSRQISILEAEVSQAWIEGQTEGRNDAWNEARSWAELEWSREATEWQQSEERLQTLWQQAEERLECETRELVSERLSCATLMDEVQESTEELASMSHLLARSMVKSQNQEKSIKKALNACTSVEEGGAAVEEATPLAQECVVAGLHRQLALSAEAEAKLLQRIAGNRQTSPISAMMHFGL